VNYLLDSTVIIDYAVSYQPGIEIVDKLFAEGGDLLTCDVVACEALSGGHPEELVFVRALLDALEYVSVDPGGARWAGDRRHERIDAGRRKPGIGDALIAGLAWRLGATVVTRNAKDFEGFDIPVLGYGAPLT
jgi:predicted nucleic acid-binding protein